VTLAFLGTPELSARVLVALLDAGVEIGVVVTRPDRRRGRRSEPEPSPVKALALERGLYVSEDPRQLLEISPMPNLGIVVAYGRIISAEVLAAVPMVNLHFSLLPRWRGAAPVERAMLAGDAVTGVCLMEVVEELDAGGVYDHRELAIEANDSAAELRDRLVDLGIEMLLDRLENGLGEPVAQSGEVTYAEKITTEDLRIDWAADPNTLDRLVRVGGAWTTFRGKRIKVLEASMSDGGLVPDVVQLEGRRPMSYEEWQRGVRFEPGEWFV